MARRVMGNHLRVLGRGATLACGVCGRRGLFRRYVHMAEECPRCGFHFERDEGFFVGAVGMNTILSFGLLLISVITFLAVTYPDIPAGPWVFAVAVIVAPVPYLLYPLSKTLWLAVELVMKPPAEGEVLPRDQWRD